jgi:ribulose-5-phosphate 4-epimerase/fuculose-1-phosphate aldolase
MTPPHPQREGVIRFDARHSAMALDGRVFGDTARTLAAWREILAHLRLLGRDAARYEGLGYGNVSARVGPFGDVARGRRRFLVTGTQTAGLAHATLREFCLVESWDLGRNQVTSSGLVQPSSESLTHAALYDASPAIRAVLHAHAPDLWRQARALGIPVTDAAAANGTPAMALEVARLFREGTLASTRIAAMGGHEDGVIALGASAEEAGGVLVRQVARALALKW